MFVLNDKKAIQIVSGGRNRLHRPNPHLDLSMKFLCFIVVGAAAGLIENEQTTAQVMILHLSTFFITPLFSKRVLLQQNSEIPSEHAVQRAGYRHDGVPHAVNLHVLVLHSSIHSFSIALILAFTVIPFLVP